MLTLSTWMRVVGVLYLVMCIAALTGTPIRAEGPVGAIGRAKAGDPLARFLVNTWVTLGLLLGVLGAMLLYFSGEPVPRDLAWLVIAIELAWGVPVDVFKIMRGQRKAPSIVWIIIHLVVACLGLNALGVIGVV